MVSEEEDLDVILYFLEEGRTRAGNLAKGAESLSTKKFAQDCYDGLSSLIRMQARVVSELKRAEADGVPSAGLEYHQKRFVGI